MRHEQPELYYESRQVVNTDAARSTVPAANRMIFLFIIFDFLSHTRHTEPVKVAIFLLAFISHCVLVHTKISINILTAKSSVFTSAQALIFRLFNHLHIVRQAFDLPDNVTITIYA